MRGGMTGDVGGGDGERQAVAMRQVSHELGVIRAVGAQAVVQVGHMQRHTEGRGQMDQCVEQGNRVGPAGHGDHDCVASVEQAAADNGPLGALKQRLAAHDPPAKESGPPAGEPWAGRRTCRASSPVAHYSRDGGGRRTSAIRGEDG